MSQMNSKKFLKRKKRAVALGEDWVGEKLKNYDQPTAKRTHRGGTIGFSLQKEKAALLMILHSTLPLLEIAQMAGVKEPVLRVWRTQRNFKDREYEVYEEFGRDLNKAIEYGMEKVTTAPKFYLKTKELVELIPFFHPFVIGSFRKLVMEKYQAGQREYVILASRYLSGVIPFIPEFFKKDHSWIRHSEILTFYKILIEDFIDTLADPNIRKLLSEEEIQKTKDFLKQITLDLINSLIIS